MVEAVRCVNVKLRRMLWVVAFSFAAMGCSSSDERAACGADASPYVACGCGCCVGVEPTVRCLTARDDLCDLIEQDRAAAASPDCATAGCAAGVEYRLCPN